MARRVPVRSRASLPKGQLKERICLRCDQVFFSEGPYHRLCQACREYLNALPTPEEEYSLGYL
jgi:hypothetical protein